VVQPIPAGPPFHLVIVKPPVGCPTGEVYKRFKRGEASSNLKAMYNAFTTGDPEKLAAAMFNMLQPAAFDLQPLVRWVYDRLTDCHPLGVMLCGSGASVFAVARSAADAAAIAERFARHTDPELAACRVFAVRTL
jgi:4-diphosphocytidyl-2-C-methyl-D-erythritol kinase